ncbi:MAG TPA: hypothetical protein VIB39_16660 [Candidatus Angelobacter sp.]|jgi:hypothetical protein
MDTYLIQQALQHELLPGENLVWSGQPSRHVIFHKDDIFAIPFSLMWGGFALFWEYMALQGAQKGGAAVSLFVFWGIPFVLAGQYFIWGRFLYTWWIKRRIFYAVTEKRAIIVRNAWGSKTTSVYLDQMPALGKDLRSDGFGTVRFGNPTPQPTGRRKNLGSLDPLENNGIPSFVDVENAEAVFFTLAELREKATTRSTEQRFSGSSLE